MSTRFHETTITIEHLAEGIAADSDADGHLDGIEMLDAVKRLGDLCVFHQAAGRMRKWVAKAFADWCFERRAQLLLE
ncbi:MAG: DUF2283 domain-containing protein [Ardenticatenaceae bacterium]|nr:DUF2283 domain-containing protein [Ardenticatenaceae bacterium]HBY97201.1 hypothetical protein [Chloroflexota bacterium]